MGYVKISKDQLSATRKVAKSLKESFKKIEGNLDKFKSAAQSEADSWESKYLNVNKSRFAGNQDKYISVDTDGKESFNENGYNIELEAKTRSWIKERRTYYLSYADKLKNDLPECENLITEVVESLKKLQNAVDTFESIHPSLKEEYLKLEGKSENSKFAFDSSIVKLEDGTKINVDVLQYSADGSKENMKDISEYVNCAYTYMGVTASSAVLLASNAANGGMSDEEAEKAMLQMVKQTGTVADTTLQKGFYSVASTGSIGAMYEDAMGKSYDKDKVNTKYHSIAKRYGLSAADYSSLLSEDTNSTQIGGMAMAGAIMGAISLGSVIDEKDNKNKENKKKDDVPSLEKSSKNKISARLDIEEKTKKKQGGYFSISSTDSAVVGGGAVTGAAIASHGVSMVGSSQTHSNSSNQVSSPSTSSSKGTKINKEDPLDKATKKLIDNREEVVERLKEKTEGQFERLDEEDIKQIVDDRIDSILDKQPNQEEINDSSNDNLNNNEVNTDNSDNSNSDNSGNDMNDVIETPVISDEVANGITANIENLENEQSFDPIHKETITSEEIDNRARDSYYSNADSVIERRFDSIEKYNNMSLEEKIEALENVGYSNEVATTLANNQAKGQMAYIRGIEEQDLTKLSNEIAVTEGISELEHDTKFDDGHTEDYITSGEVNLDLTPVSENVKIARSELSSAKQAYDESVIVANNAIDKANAVKADYDNVLNAIQSENGTDPKNWTESQVEQYNTAFNNYHTAANEANSLSQIVETQKGIYEKEKLEYSQVFENYRKETMSTIASDATSDVVDNPVLDSDVVTDSTVNADNVDAVITDNGLVIEEDNVASNDEILTPIE